MLNQTAWVYKYTKGPHQFLKYIGSDYVETEVELYHWSLNWKLAPCIIDQIQSTLPLLLKDAITESIPKPTIETGETLPPDVDTIAKVGPLKLTLC